MIHSLTIVRHGESEWNASRRIQGHLDSPLSELGRRQAQALGRWLSPQSFTAVYSSDLSRASRTAELASGLPPENVIKTPALREISFGPWEGLSPEQVRERFPGEWEAFRRDPVGARPRGSETMDSLRERVSELLEQWGEGHPGGHLLAVAHGGPVRMLIILSLGLPLERWRSLRVANTGVTRVEFSHNGPPVLRYFDLTCHLLGLQETVSDESDPNTVINRRRPRLSR